MVMLLRMLHLMLTMVMMMAAFGLLLFSVCNAVPTEAEL